MMMMMTMMVRNLHQVADYHLKPWMTTDKCDDDNYDVDLDLDDKSNDNNP